MRRFFSIEIETPNRPPPNFKGSVDDWQTLSPGYRREIYKQFIERENGASEK